MPIKVNCPECEAAFNLPDASAGKRVRCRVCDHPFVVPLAELDEAELADDRLQAEPRRPAVPARRPDRDRDRDDDDGRPNRRRPARRDAEPGSSGLPLALILGGAAAGLLLLVGGLALAFFLVRSSPGPGPVAGPAPPLPPVGGVAGGPSLRYRFQGDPAVYSFVAAVTNANHFDVHQGHLLVTAGGGEQFTLRCQTGLSVSRLARPVGAEFTPPPGGPPVAPAGRTAEIDTDATGHIRNAPRNDHDLPVLLGGAARFLLEPLPLADQPTWDRTANWTITGVDDGPFGRGPFRPRVPFRPRPPFGPPGIGGEKTQPAVERSVYTRRAVDGDRVTIDKRYELKGDATPGMTPFTLHGTKTIVFDAKAGLPRSLEFTGQYEEVDGNATIRLPLTVSARLLEGADRERVVNAHPPQPKGPVTPPPPPPAGPLTGAELKGVLADLAGTDGFKRSRAVQRLKGTRPLADRAEAAKALARLAGDEATEGFLRRDCVELLGTWGDGESVPVLLPLVEHRDVFLRGAAIAALGKLKDERAAEPLARRLSEQGDRIAASTALKALGSKAERAVAAVAVAKHDGPLGWSVQLEAVRILKEIATAQSKPALEQAAKDSNGLVAREAKAALDALAKR